MSLRYKSDIKSDIIGQPARGHTKICDSNAFGVLGSTRYMREARSIMDEIISFGEWIKLRRRALDLSQEALAQRVSYSVATIRKIEADGQRPSRDLAAKLAEHLRIAPEEYETFVSVARGNLRV